MTVTHLHHCPTCGPIKVALELPDGTTDLEVGLRVREIGAAGRDVHEVSTHLVAVQP